mmetsp:Transcript_2078/g.3190  ORF Transcript_2078/g.3190 Transcript_2078/m.3190 type:complete len:622 (+) Transcript_2078:128-1993(+)
MLCGCWGGLRSGSQDVLIEAQREQRRASALVEVLKAVVLTKKGLVSRLLQIGKEVMACEQVTLFFMDEARGVLVAANTMEAKEICVKVGQGIAGSVAYSKKAANIADAYKDNRFDQRTDMETGFRTKSVLCAPVLDCRGECVAVIQALNKKTGAQFFDDEDEFVLATLASELQRPLRRAAMEHAFRGACVRAEHDDEPSMLAMLFSGTDEDKEIDAVASVVASNLKLKKDTENTMVQSYSSEYASQNDNRSKAQDVARGLSDGEINAFNSYLYNLAWDVTSATEIEVRRMILAIMEADDSIRIHKVDRKKLGSFFDSIQSSYRDNYYHNFEHGVCVMHASFVVSRISKLISTALFPIDLLALKLAAIGHDVDHPGTNNDFEINTNSHRALIYNDIAVLENHHASFFFITLRKPQCDALCALSRAEYTHFRKIVINSILATDMSRHGKHVQFLRDAADAYHRQDCEETIPSSQFLVDTCIHLGDLINSTHPDFSVVKKWGFRVIAEFKYQAALELKLGLPVSPSMTKLETNSDIAHSQLGFIDYVVYPLVAAACDLMPELNQLEINLAKNRQGWADLGTGSSSQEKEEYNRQRVHPIRNAGKVRTVTRATDAVSRKDEDGAV